MFLLSLSQDSKRKRSIRLTLLTGDMPDGFLDR